LAESTTDDNLEAELNEIENHDTGRKSNPATKPGVAPLEKLPFQLQNGEKIMRELKPQLLGFMLTRGLGSYIGLLALSISIIVGSVFLNEIPLGVLIGVIIIPCIMLAISIGPLISYGKSWYWITNHRVIGKRGFFGYSVDSIPLENVSDVVLSRTLLDRILGLSSLIVVPMGGSSKAGGGSADERAQNPNFFPALPEKLARELQRVLFNLRDELKKPQGVQPAYVTIAPSSSEAAQLKYDVPRTTS
jgi:membrane protein YdbS with pleckstrin-like domain